MTPYYAEDFMFVTFCPFCRRYLDVQRVPAVESWGPAVQWGYLAQRNHVCQPPLIGAVS